jgi:hypothetical protein
MLSCKDTTRLMSEAMDRELSLRERFTLRMHLIMCSGCNSFKKQMGFLKKVGNMQASGGEVTKDKK